MQVFISYAKEDLQTALALYADLKKAGMTPWMDEKDLLHGQNRKVIIPLAIRESRFFIALLSSNSLSKRGYVQAEMKKALEILDEFPADGIFIIPARIDECEPMDEKLGRLHRVDLFPSYSDGLAKILKSLGGEDARNGQPEPRTAMPKKRERAETPPKKTETDGLPGWVPKVSFGTLTFLILLMVVAVFISNQIKQPLSGIVVDEKGNPLSSAKVMIPEFNVEKLTNKIGAFSFEIEAEKELSVKLIAQKEGFETVHQYVSLGNTSFSVPMKKQ